MVIFSLRHLEGSQMKGLVVYDSRYGNTKVIAAAIAEELKAEGEDVELRSVADGLPEKLDADFVFVGSPTRMGKMTGPAKRVIKRLAKSSWGSKPVILFDTIMRVPGKPEPTGKWAKTAADWLYDLAKERGLDAHSEVYHGVVTGMKGPLEKDSVEKTRAWVKDFLSNMRH